MYRQSGPVTTCSYVTIVLQRGLAKLEGRVPRLGVA